MINIVRRAVLASLLVLAGCAAPPVAPVKGNSLAPLKSARIAVSYLFVKKNFNTTELFYRTADGGDFSAAWPAADKDAAAELTADLRARGFNAESDFAITPALAEKANLAWGRECIDESVDTNPMSIDRMPGLHRELPLPRFFLQKPESRPYQDLQDALKGAGFRYLFQVTAMDLNAKAVGYGMVTVSTTPNARVIDLQTGEVIWSTFFYQSDLQQLGGDLSKLMSNDMEKTRSAVKSGLAKQDFPKLWGL